MTKIAAAPFLTRCKFSVGADEYTAHLSQAEFQPTQPTASFTDLDGLVTNFGGVSAWQLVLAGAQDWDTVNSLTALLNNSEGDDLTVSLEVPGGEWGATVVAAAVNIGGTTGTPATFQKTLSVKGKPTFTPTA